MKKVIVQLTISMAVLLQPLGALAEECEQVSFGPISWTDVQAVLPRFHGRFYRGWEG